MHEAWEQYYSGTLAADDVEDARSLVRAMGERVRATMTGEDAEEEGA